MTANSLIDATLAEIANRYHPGTLRRMKTNRSEEWGQMVVLEKEINWRALQGDKEGLKEALERYQALILGEQ